MPFQLLKTLTAMNELNLPDRSAPVTVMNCDAFLRVGQLLSFLYGYDGGVS